jgi:hypothetical protein
MLQKRVSQMEENKGIALETEMKDLSDKGTSPKKLDF